MIPRRSSVQTKMTGTVFFTAILLAGALMLFHEKASAHGAVKSMAQQVGEYTVEFEYNTLNDVVAGEPMGYTVRLLQKDGTPSLFGSAIVIMRDDQQNPIAAGEFIADPAEPGSTKLNATMPRQGRYTATTRFRHGAQELAAADFSFEVFPGTSASGQAAPFKKYFPFLTLLVGILSGSIATWVLVKIKKK